MTAKIIHINEAKAVSIIKDMVREWRTRENGWNDTDILDVFCERAVADGVVSQGEIDHWDDRDAARRARIARLPWWQG